MQANPDPTFARLRFLAGVMDDLAGGYDETGVRRWFDRRRTALGDRAPAEVLADGWMPDDEGPERVKRLAAGVRSAATT